jgi:hypothetical protein
MNELETREFRIKILIQRGYNADLETGKVYNRLGKEVTYKEKTGYLSVATTLNKKTFIVKQHQFIYYLSTGKVVDMIDHKNGIRNDNRIDNLRESNSSHNQQNAVNAKGYTLFNNKYKAQISSNGNILYLGYYKTEEEAHQAYLDAKKIYHTASV